MSRIIPVYAASRVSTDWQCPRKRYLRYEFEEKGIVSENDPLELFLGTTVHDALAAIAYMDRDAREDLTIDLIAETARRQIFEAFIQEDTNSSEEELLYAREQASLIEGLIRGFYKFSWPILRNQYPEIVAIEADLEFYHDFEGKGTSKEEASFLYTAKPDLLVRNKEGKLYYIEYKTTSSKKDSWVASWQTAVQLHSTLRAVEQTLGEKPEGVIVQGLYKGYESYGKQSSPFCYAYGRRAYPPFDKGEVRYDYAPGFKRTPTWTMEGGVKAWVEGMPEEILQGQFPSTPPIFIDEKLVDNYFKQRAAREAEILLYRDLKAKSDEASQEVLLNNIFPQRFDQCVPSFGRPCLYRKICHGNLQEPLKAGFKYRESLHPLDMEV